MGKKLTTKGMVLLASLLIVLTALVVPAGLAQANHVRIDINTDPHQPSSAPPDPSAPPAPPAPTTTYVPAPMPQTLQADEIKAHVVRADTIYANRIEADEVQGRIHQTKSVKISDAHGDIRAPEVSASVIYAEKINANSVVAQNVYVRDLRRR